MEHPPPKDDDKWNWLATLTMWTKTFDHRWSCEINVLENGKFHFAVRDIYQDRRAVSSGSTDTLAEAKKTTLLAVELHRGATS